MNSTIVHRMIRTFTGYGAPDVRDDVGPNKADWPFFSRVANADFMADYELLEAAERFHKYRNTQLPSILIDAGLIENEGQVLRFLDKMKAQGEQAKVEYDRLEAAIHEKHRIRSAVKHSITKRLLSRQWDKTTDFNNSEDEEIDGWVGKVAESYECKWDEAVTIIEEFVANWRPPTSKVVSFSMVEDSWTNRWGKQFTSNRIALTYSYNPELNNALKNNLGFPAIKFDGGTKKWTLQDNSEVLDKAKAIIIEAGMFINEQSLNTLEVSAPAVKKSIDRVTKATAELIGNSSISLKWPFISDETLRGNLLNQVKMTQGRKFNPTTKAWTIAIGEAAPLIDRLREYDENEWCVMLADAIEAIPEVHSFMEERAKRIAISGAASLDDKMIVAEMREELANHFPADRELYPFQYVGVRFAQLAGGRALIGDDMGIGKTIQALAHIALNQDQLPALVICPASVKYNWLKEARAWLPNMTSAVVEGRSKGTLPDADIVICNYDIISGRLNQLLDADFNIVVCDESHYLKNSKAKRTEATLTVAQQSKSVLCLSGTAVTNRPNEFFTTLNLLRPNEFPSFFNYGQQYCDGFQTRFGWDFTGASNTEELHHRTRDFCIRRLKQEVLTELPDKVRTIVDIQPSKADLKQYTDLHRSWMDEYELHMNHRTLPAGFVLNMLTALRHECGLIKVPSTVEYIKEYRNITGKPLVVFAHHADVLNSTVKLLMEDKDYKWRIAGIKGDMPAHIRQKNVEAFQEGHIDVLFCSTMAAKEGITLTRADTVVFIEREWVPGWEEQAEDRVYRIGQDSDSVHAVYLSVAKTIDEKFNYVIEEKRKVVKAVLDGGSMEEREGIANALIQSMIASGDLPAEFGKKVKA